MKLASNAQIFDDSVAGQVLVVDDERANRKLYASCLEREGFEVETANDGIRALEMLAERSFDVVILDIMMPGLDGIEVLRALNVSGDIQKQAVIVITADGAREVRRRALGLGAIDFIEKPVDRFEIVCKARTVSELAKLRKTMIRQVELTERERHVRVYEATPDCVVYVDVEGRISYGNSAVRSATGKQDLVGLELGALFPPWAQTLMLDTAIPAAKAHGTWRGDSALLDENGQELPTDQIVLHQGDGHSSELAVIMRDMTSVRAKEAELLDAKDAAEGQARAKAQFLANMSHEIRTPVNAIEGMTTLMLEHELSQQQRDRAEVLKSSSTHLTALVNDILDFTKIDENRMAIETEQCNVRLVVERTVEALGIQTSDDVELALCVDPALPAMMVTDAMRLRQILVNLVGNACKFTHAGHVIVHLAYDHSSESLTLAVEDSGIGIAEDRLDMIFDSFTQGEATLDRVYGGTGLGLAIVKRIAELMGGTVAVSSTVGRGSVFSVTVPTSVSLDQETTQPLSGRRGLLVADEGPIRKNLEAWLTHWGCVLTTCDSANIPAPLPEGLDFFVVDEGVSVEASTRFLESLSEAEANCSTLITRLPVSSQLDLCAAVIAKPLRIARLAQSLETQLGVSMGQEFSTESEHRPGQSIQRCLEDLRVLLVDDVLAGRLVGQEILEHIGCVVDTARDGREAVEMFGASAFDVIFMDCHMPALNGYDATRAIREIEARDERARMPIIALTAGITHEVREACFAAGMDEFITKPVTAETLVHELTRSFPDRATSAAPDPDDIQKIAADAEGLGGQFHAIFVSGSRKHLEALVRAAAVGDMSAAATSAHALRGSLGTLATPELLEAANEAEQAAERGEAANVREKVSAVQELSATILGSAA